MKQTIDKNLDISLLLVDSKAFSNFKKNIESQGRHFLLNGVKQMAEVNLETETKGSIEVISGVSINYSEVFSNLSDHELLTRAFKEELQDFFNGSNSEDNQIGLFESLLMFYCSSYFKNLFFVVPKYSPPIKYSKIFKDLYTELDQTVPKGVVYLNPFFPFCNQLEEAGIYYVMLKPEMTRKIFENFSKLSIPDNNSLELIDYIFMKDFLWKASEGALKIFLQRTP